MSKASVSARHEAVGSRAMVAYFTALHSVPHLNDIHQYSDKRTAGRARLGERGTFTLQGRERSNRSFWEFLRSYIQSPSLVDNMIQYYLAVANQETPSICI